MKKTRSILLLAAAAATIFLNACGDKTTGVSNGKGEDAAIVALIKARIISPETATFQPVLKSADGKKACVIWEGANSMGGRNSSASFLSNQEGNWSFPAIQYIIRNKESCNQQALEAWDPTTVL